MSDPAPPKPTPSRSDHASWPIWLLAALGLGLQIGAILWQPYVPLVDLPNHMARHVLEADWLAGRPLPEFYQIEYRVVPNLGADLVMPLLLQVLEPVPACKLFLALAVILYWLGPTLYLLQVCDQRRAAWCAALLLLPWSLSSQFFWGFLNYYSGFGLAFLLLAHGVRLQERATAGRWEWLLHAVLVAVLFLWHLAVWGIYGVLMASRVAVELAIRHRRGDHWALLARRALAFVALWLPSLVLFAIYVLQQKSTQGVGETNWGTWVRKLYMPLTLFRGYHTAADVAAIVCWIVAIVLLFVAVPRKPKLDYTDAPTRVNCWAHVLGLLALAGLYFAIPFQLGGTSDTDSRLLPAMLIVGLALVASLPVRRLALGLALLLVCLVVRQASVVMAWHELAPRLQTQARAFEHLTPQCRMLPLVLVPESKLYPELHFPCWAVITHRAFVPTLFAFGDQQPLRLTSTRLPVANDGHTWRFDEDAVRREFDFVWIYNPNNAVVAVPSFFEIVFEADGLKLFRVRQVDRQKS